MPSGQAPYGAPGRAPQEQNTMRAELRADGSTNLRPRAHTDDVLVY
jgi:hypothetical protein